MIDFQKHPTSYAGFNQSPKPIFGYVLFELMLINHIYFLLSFPPQTIYPNYE